MDDPESSGCGGREGQTRGFEIFNGFIYFEPPEQRIPPLLQRIKYDTGFVPCHADSGDEVFRNGFFVFNISKLSAYLQSDDSDVLLEEVQTNTFPAEFSTINENHLNSVSLEQPVIIVKIAPQSYNLIDGHHRMEKARRSGVDKLPCYKLSVTQHINFLTTRKAYDAYVEYWNGKL